MTTKQEKLAAARRKLKEFQGKNKEVEISKEKSKDGSFTKVSRDNFYTNDSVAQSSLLISELDNSQNNHLSTDVNCVAQHFTEKTRVNELVESKTSNSSSPDGNTSKLWLECHGPNEKLCTIKQGDPSDGENGLKEERTGLHDMAKISVGSKEFFDNNTSNKSSLSDIIEPLQMELQNHAQTINILIQQRNDAQTALTEAQQMLHKKSGEAEELKLQTSHLTSSIHNLSQRLLDAEDVIMKLKLEKEENLQKQEEIKLLAHKFQVQLDVKEEEILELKRKYEEKNNHCEKLLFSLQEAQSQLSLHQIQLQQYSVEGHSSLAVQISELQNENLCLKQKIMELEKKLEVEATEKEESSQKFHIYAQQCNSQLNSLNSQLKSLELENKNLSEENKILSKTLSELESAKEKENSYSSKSFENEIADLHNQLSALSEKNNQLSNDVKEKKEECSRLGDELEKKESELNKLLEELKDLEEKYKNLAKDAETPKANERLLATMESDKIAAAKAVSQNQKLKEQIVELEKAFIKLSEEKLELTNELAHEKHVKTELQNLIKNAEAKLCEEDDHSHHECSHGTDNPEPLLNDSNEIEELRAIVRQLQDDKMELTARLNSYESNRSNSEEYTEKQKQKCEHSHEPENEHAHGDKQCEDTRLLLQKMEEKVRKTMNEIAVLDEEKEKLEHLVLQLQGETETIGEYITLYQKQRMLLRQRAQEKDIQLLQLSKDKEELKAKLVALDELVQRLVAEKENISVQPGSKLPATNFSTRIPDNTIGKIRALINEIGSTTLINNHSIAFEHCSCCSGRLITI